MRFIKRWLGGLSWFGNHEVNKESENEIDANEYNSPEELDQYINPNLPRNEFSVPVQVPVDRAHQIGPILVPCPAGDGGGVQGLQWYARRLKIDEDGDVADEFLEEVFPETVSMTEELHQKTCSQFKVKLSTKPAKARNPRISREGMVQHQVRYEGRLQLV